MSMQWGCYETALESHGTHGTFMAPHGTSSNIIVETHDTSSWHFRRTSWHLIVVPCQRHASAIAALYGSPMVVAIATYFTKVAMKLSMTNSRFMNVHHVLTRVSLKFYGSL